jgi:hypothetical protein
LEATRCQKLLVKGKYIGQIRQRKTGKHIDKLNTLSSLKCEGGAGRKSNAKNNNIERAVILNLGYAYLLMYAAQGGT